MILQAISSYLTKQGTPNTYYTTGIRIHLERNNRIATAWITTNTDNWILLHTAYHTTPHTTLQPEDPELLQKITQLIQQ